VASDEAAYKKELNRDLDMIANRYTTDRYPATEDTQRSFQQDLDLLHADYSKRMQDQSTGERGQLDRDFKEAAERKLNDQERSQWPKARTDDDLWRIRSATVSQREDLQSPDPQYRTSPAYLEKMDRLTKLQDKRNVEIGERFQKAHDDLNDRFGFTRDRVDPNDRDR
jgi:hypothetical protein